MDVGRVVISLSIPHGYSLCLTLIKTLLSIYVLSYWLPFGLVRWTQWVQESLLHFLYRGPCIVQILAFLLWSHPFLSWNTSYRLKGFLYWVFFDVSPEVIVPYSIVVVFTPFNKSVINVLLGISLFWEVFVMNFLQRMGHWLVKVVGLGWSIDLGFESMLLRQLL